VTDDDRLSQVVRRQLYDLRIDPGGIRNPPWRVASRLKTWCGDHREAILLIAIGVTILLVVTGVGFALVAGMGAQLPSGSGTGMGAPLSTTVSLDNAVVQVQPPDYRRVSTVESTVLVHLDVRNTTNAQTVLRASDVVLADTRGALFPPSWQDANGKSIDGVADPNHTLVALEPGADVQIGLQFIVLTYGPFDLRYAPGTAPAGGGSPTLSLSTGP
jgi:hypothetical protein